MDKTFQEQVIKDLRARMEAVPEISTLDLLKKVKQFIEELPDDHYHPLLAFRVRRHIAKLDKEDPNAPSNPAQG